MKPNYQDLVYEDSDMSFPASEADVLGYGKWVFMAPFHENNTPSITIWHTSQPLLRFSNSHTSGILDLIGNELSKWLDPYSMEPLAVPKFYQLPHDHVLIYGRGCSAEDMENEAFKIALNYVEWLAAFQAKFSTLKTPFHIAWASEDAAFCYPRPSFGSLMSSYPRPRLLMQVVLSLMRFPGLYDGSPDLIFERKIGAAIKLLFSPWCDVDSPSPCGKYRVDGLSSPLITILQSETLDQEARTAFARRAHPTVVKLSQMTPKGEAFPEKYFVYGLHISPTHTSFLAHFATSMDEDGGWQFCQVILSKTSSSYDDSGQEDGEDLFLQRWRLCVALFTIIRHIIELEKILGSSSYGTQHSHAHERAVTRLDGNDQCESSKPVPRSTQADLRNLRGMWEGAKFKLPSSWMPPMNLSASTRPKTGVDGEQCPHYSSQLASILFDRIRSRVDLLHDDAVTKIHLSSDGCLDPDFLHPVHAPRSYFLDHSYREDNANGKPGTLPHYFKASDFMSMIAPSWEDVNIFVADVVAGFSTYSVQWKPTVRYPTMEPEFKSELCVVDFALAPRSIPATMLVTMKRSRSLPLTISSPAVLLGIRAADLHSDGQSVSEKEMASLTEAMRPHLNLFASLRHYKDVMIPSYAPPVKAQPTLFCTYLKRGFLHILAFALSGHDDSQVSGHLVDSLPLSLEYATQEDLSDRLRIAVALFTLQRQAVRICDGWNSICWPPSVLIDEHEAIVEVTGVTTPTPSARLPPPPSEPDPFDIFECVYDPEDDPDYMKGVIAKSAERVSVWLSGLDQPDDDVRHCFLSL